MGLRFSFGVGIFEDITTSDSWADIIIQMKRVYKEFKNYESIKALHSFISSNSDLLFIDKQEVVLDNRKYIIILYDHYEVDSILENAFKNIEESLNVINNKNFICQSWTMTKVGWRYVILFKSKYDEFKQTMQSLFLDKAFLNYSVKDLGNLKNSYETLLQKLSNYEIAEDEFDCYQDLHEIFERISVEIRKYYSWTRDWMENVPSEKAKISINDLLDVITFYNPEIVEKIKNKFGNITIYNDNPESFMDFYKSWMFFVESEFKNTFNLKDYDLIFFLNSLITSGNPSNDYFVDSALYDGDTFESIYKYIMTPLNYIEPNKTLTQLEKIKNHLKMFISMVDYMKNNLDSLIRESIDYTNKMKVHFAIPSSEIIENLWCIGDTEKKNGELCLDLPFLVQLIPQGVNYLKQKTGLFLVSKSDYLLHYYTFDEMGVLECYQRRSILDYWKIDVFSSIYEVIEKKMKN